MSKHGIHPEVVLHEFYIKFEDYVFEIFSISQLLSEICAVCDILLLYLGYCGNSSTIKVQINLNKEMFQI